MFKKILFVVLAFSNALAHDLPSAVDRVNAVVRSSPNQQPHCENCTPQQPVTPAVQCIQQICPDPQESISQQMLTAYSNSQASDAYYESVLPLVESASQTEAQTYLELQRALQSWIDTAPQLEDPETIRIFNLFSMINRVEFKELPLKAGPNQRMQVDREQLPKVQMERVKYEELVQMVPRIEAHFARYQALDFPTSNDAGQLLMFYPGNRLQEKVNEVISATVADATWIVNNTKSDYLRGYFQTEMTEERLRRPFRNGILNPVAVAELKEARFVTNLLRAVLEDETTKQMFNSGPIDVRSYYQQQGLGRRLEGQNEGLETIAAGQSNTDRAYSCVGAFQLAQTFLPTDAELGQLRSNTAANTPLFFRKLNPLLSSLSGSEMRKRSANWQPTFPQTREAHKRQMIQALQSLNTSLRQEAERTRRTLQSNQRDHHLSIILATTEPSERFDTSQFGVEQTCTEFFPQIISDAANPGGNRFAVGPMGARYPQHAANILSHELAHLTFTELSVNMSPQTKTWFENSKQCLLRQHPAGSAAEKYLAEDWADLMAGVANLTTSNTSCLFMGSQDYGIEELFNLQNPNAEDTHSSALYRLLHHEFLAGREIPASCTAALRSRGQSLPNFQNCGRPASSSPPPATN